MISTGEGTKIAVIGLGYVGLPLATLFARKYPVIGYDHAESHVRQLQNGRVDFFDIQKSELLEVVEQYQFTQGASGLKICHSENDIADCNIFIVAVPTPVDSKNLPDLQLLKKASTLIGKKLKKGDLVIYESTVYPGCTKEEMVPILESESKLVFNIDFTVGYSPERINPGDLERRLENIVKVTAGSTPDAAKRVKALYQTVITAGIYAAPSIQVAEAAKVIENTQRDVNIAFMNELSKAFTALGIDMKEVLKAASTKWNFLPFYPGLVGGHCIGVDPYYFIHRTEQAGFKPDLIKSARAINDSMGTYVAERMASFLTERGIDLTAARVLILGITFKANVSDTRNSRVKELVKTLVDKEVVVDLYDPMVNAAGLEEEYAQHFIRTAGHLTQYDGIIVAVAHDLFQDFDYQKHLKERAVLYDLCGIAPVGLVDARL